MASPTEISLLLMKHRAKVLGMIHGTIRNHHDAEDIWQEVCLVACQKSGQFETGTNFLAWSRAIAGNTIRSHRRKNGRIVPVEQDILEALCRASATRDGSEEAEAERLDALNACVSQLPKRQRELLDWRYGDRLRINTIAERLGRSVQGMYKTMMRLRLSLEQCVRQRIATST